MTEKTINGVRVVFRDRFPGEFGWDLLHVVRRVESKRIQLISEAVGHPVTAEEIADRDAPEKVRAAAESIGLFDMVYSELSFAEAAAFIRGAVGEWDFPGDLSSADCCNDMDTMKEVMPLATEALLLFYTANSREKLQGEAVRGSISTSED